MYALAVRSLGSGLKMEDKKQEFDNFCDTKLRQSSLSAEAARDSSECNDK